GEFEHARRGIDGDDLQLESCFGPRAQISEAGADVEQPARTGGKDPLADDRLVVRAVHEFSMREHTRSRSARPDTYSAATAAGSSIQLIRHRVSTFLSGLMRGRSRRDDAGPTQASQRFGISSGDTSEGDP